MFARSKLLLKIKRARDGFAALSIILRRGAGKGRCEQAVGQKRTAQTPLVLSPAGPSPPGHGKAFFIYFNLQDASWVEQLIISTQNLHAGQHSV